MENVLVETFERSSLSQLGLAGTARYLGERCMQFFRVPDIDLPRKVVAEMQLKRLMHDIELLPMYDLKNLNPDVLMGTPTALLDEFERGDD